MAKVMVSLPDDLLAAVDAAADQHGTSRSGYLRVLAERELGRATAQRAERMAEIQHSVGASPGRGGGVAALVKATRPER